MCTALVALSLVPLIGWAGQVSFAALAFAGIGAVAYTRLGGANGNGYAVILAALAVLPVGALLALPALRLQGLYLALETLAFAALVEVMFFIQPFALGTQSRPAGRLQLFGIALRRDPDVPAARHRGVRDPRDRNGRAPPARVRSTSHRAPRQ